MLLFSLFVYSLVPLFSLSSFSFHTIAYSLGLEQNNSSGASVPVNAKTIMDIRWHCKLYIQCDGPKSVPLLHIFYKDSVTAKKSKAKSSIFHCLGCFCFCFCSDTISTIQGNIASIALSYDEIGNSDKINVYNTVGCKGAEYHGKILLVIIVG